MPEPAELDRLIRDCVRQKGWTIERCRRYIAGGIWGTEFITPTPADVHVPGQTVAVKRRRQDQNTFSIKAVPVFKSGEWKGTKYTTDDLDEIVKNTNALIHSHLHEPPIKLGHTENQDLLQTEGFPAGGYVSNLYRLGDEIFVDIVDIPKKVADAIEKRAYSKVSAEIYNEFEHPTTKEKMGKVLRAVALLGADIPEIKGLGDIGGLYHSEGVYNYIAFAEKDLQEVNEMSNVWTLADVKTYLPCCVDAVQSFMEQKKVGEIKTDELANIISDVRLKKLQEEEKKCPTGFKWDEKLERCVPSGASPSDNPAEERKVCPEGYKWDDAQQKCVPVEIKKTADQKPSETFSPPRKELFQKDIADLTDDEVNEIVAIWDKDRKAGSKTGQEIAEAMKAGAEQMQAERPPKAWWDRCVARVSPVADDPAALCGWIWFHGRTEGAYAGTPTEAGGAPGPGALASEGDAKVKELTEKVKELEKAKITKLVEELKEKNRGILLPKFDNYIEAFVNRLSEDDKVIKFEEKDTPTLDLFVKFLNDLVKSKTVIFGELAKTIPEEKPTEVSEEQKAKFIERFSEVAEQKREEIKNVDMAILAENIAQTKNIPYRDALVEASKILGGGEQ